MKQKGEANSDQDIFDKGGVPTQTSSRYSRPGESECYTFIYNTQFRFTVYTFKSRIYCRNEEGIVIIRFSTRFFLKTANLQFFWNGKHTLQINIFRFLLFIWIHLLIFPRYNCLFFRGTTAHLSEVHLLIFRGISAYLSEVYLPILPRYISARLS